MSRFGPEKLSDSSRLIPGVVTSGASTVRRALTSQRTLLRLRKVEELQDGLVRRFVRRKRSSLRAYKDPSEGTRFIHFRSGWHRVLAPYGEQKDGFGSRGSTERCLNNELVPDR